MPRALKFTSLLSYLLEVNITDNLLLLANCWIGLLNFQMGYFKNVDSDP